VYNAFKINKQSTSGFYVPYFFKSFSFNSKNNNVHKFEREREREREKEIVANEVLVVI